MNFMQLTNSAHFTQGTELWIVFFEMQGVVSLTLLSLILFICVTRNPLGTQQ